MSTTTASLVNSERPVLDRVIVLGGSGFIGRQLVRELERRLPAGAVMSMSRQDLDLTDPESAVRLASLCTPTTSIVFASALKKGHKDDLELLQQNIAMVAHVARALRRQRVQQVLYFSSASVYGENRHDLAITEETPCNPVSSYGISKYAGERLLMSVCGAGTPEIPLLVLRPGIVYGPLDASEPYRPSGFASNISMRQSITLYGDGSEQRDFIHVADVAVLAARLLLTCTCGTVNLVTGERRSFRDIIDLLAAELQQEPQINSRPRTKPQVDQAFLPHRLRLLCPDHECRPLADGLRDVAAAVAAPGEIMEKREKRQRGAMA